MKNPLEGTRQSFQHDPHIGERDSFEGSTCLLFLFGLGQPKNAVIYSLVTDCILFLQRCMKHGIFFQLHLYVICSFLLSSTCWITVGDSRACGVLLILQMEFSTASGFIELPFACVLYIEILQMCTIGHVSYYPYKFS